MSLVGLNGTSKQLHPGYKVFLGSPKASNYFAVQMYYMTEQEDQANRVENGWVDTIVLSHFELISWPKCHQAAPSWVPCLLRLPIGFCLLFYTINNYRTEWKQANWLENGQVDTIVHRPLLTSILVLGGPNGAKQIHLGYKVIPGSATHLATKFKCAFE
jgi:hypothetical protein